MDILGLRQQLKDSFRTVHPSGGDTVRDDKYGHYFGPSEIVLGKRLIENAKSWVDINPESLLRKFDSKSKNGDKTEKVTRVILDAVEKKKKVQSLKYSRDYSCLLSDDCQVLVSGKRSVPCSDSSRISSLGGVKERGFKHSNTTEKDSDSEIRTVRFPGKESVLNGGSTDSKKIDAKNSKIKGSEIKNHKIVKKVCSATVAKSSKLALDKSKIIPSKTGSLDRKKLMGEEKNPTRTEQKKRKAQELDNVKEEELAIGIIRRMFRYDPTKFSEDKDDKNMEASFMDIQKEERRSTKIARKEDADELKKIMAEEKSKKTKDNADELKKTTAGGKSKKTIIRIKLHK